jgi:hypothetical protein
MFLIAASITVATATAISSLSIAVVSAEKCGGGTPCDGWGDSTSDAATNDGKAVGEHTKDADANGDEPGREGLGNFAKSQTGNKNPSDLGDAVGGELP